MHIQYRCSKVLNTEHSMLVIHAQEFLFLNIFCFKDVRFTIALISTALTVIEFDFASWDTCFSS